MTPSARLQTLNRRRSCTSITRRRWPRLRNITERGRRCKPGSTVRLTNTAIFAQQPTDASQLSPERQSEWSSERCKMAYRCMMNRYLPISSPWEMYLCKTLTSCKRWGYKPAQLTTRVRTSSIRSKEPRFSARLLLLSTVIRRSTAIGTERIKKAWVSKQTRR